MKPRGDRIACSLESEDGARGVFSVHAGAEPNSVARVDPVEWGEKKPTGNIKVAMFSIIGDMGYTGQIIRITGEDFLALMRTKLIGNFYAAILWGGGPMKIVKDAQLLAKRPTTA